MLKVTIRFWNLKKGRCAYLDIYHQGQRVRENLHILLTGDKMADRDAMRKAEILRARRESELLSDIHGLIETHRGAILLTKYAETCGTTGVNLSLKHLKAYFPAIQLKAVTRIHLQGYQDYLLKELKRSTVSSYINTIVAVFNRAVKERIIKESPAIGLERVHGDEEPVKSLTDQELTALETTRYGNLEGLGGEIRKAFLFACRTGVRISDIKALTWGKIRISSTGRQVESTQVKTKAVIYVPVNDTAWSQVDPGDHIPPASTKVFPLIAATKTNVNTYLASWAKAAKIGHLNFHMSRHTFPRFLLNAGVDLVTVQALMGHKKVETTARYGKASDKRKVEAVMAIN